MLAGYSLSRVVSLIQGKSVLHLPKQLPPETDAQISQASYISFHVHDPPKLWRERSHQQYWFARSKNSSLDEKRQQFLRSFTQHVRRAYSLVERNQSSGRTTNLRQPLEHLHQALKDLSRVKNYDDQNPISRAELPPELQDHSAEAIWLQVKLEHTKACLQLLVQILRHVRPENNHFWVEFEEALHMENWHMEFSFDTDESLERTSLPLPRRQEVLEWVRQTQALRSQSRMPSDSLERSEVFMMRGIMNQCEDGPLDYGFNEDA
ncbi:hypothetical protein AB5N19_02107 [Seiridium cardinale]